MQQRPCHHFRLDQTTVKSGLEPAQKPKGRAEPHLMGAKAAACWRCLAMEAACSMGSTLRRRPPAITVRTICTHTICLNCFNGFLTGQLCLLRQLQVQAQCRRL